MNQHEQILALVATLPGPACAAAIYAADRGGLFESEADAASKLSNAFNAGYLSREKLPNPNAGKLGARKEVFFYSAGMKPIVQDETKTKEIETDFPVSETRSGNFETAADHYGAWLRINDQIEAWQTAADSLGIRTPDQLREVTLLTILADIREALGADGGQTMLVDLPERIRTLASERDILRAGLETHTAEAARMVSKNDPPLKLAKPLGYACMVDGDDVIIYTNPDEARQRAEDALLGGGHTLAEQFAERVHVVAILDTAELSVAWKEAA
jgi:hypothetical protein